MAKNKEKQKEPERGNDFNSFLKLFISVFIIVVATEIFGTKTFKIGPGQVVLLPMLFAVIIGMLITPDLLGSKIKALKKVISMQEVEKAGTYVMIALLPLGVKYGTLVGPNIVEVVKAGPAFLLQELGNLGTIFIALPLALLLGMKREAVGATASIAREPTLGVIGEKYGISSPEGTGVLGTYLMGTVFGTIFFGLLGGYAAATGLHPLALAMASGMGSGSMMAAASGALAEAVPAMKDEILAYAATSNMLTGVTGLYSVIFLGLPLVNFLYDKLSPILSKKDRGDQ
ncbi:MAG: hypothetical protein A8274_503 [Halanaerobium sp. 4-GBenrich]|jgi:hypothetical protein|uniref:DUF3100 family protein n=1 Tax=Halanaerobium congolense TaxID=54121 RepID=A0A1G6NHS2_9FIRM|nr:DUF3100 domain-containing protein [Halanaerobium congolense]KXS49189.1 MAG: hypothetical protein AWL62_1275 [Halanaerobium sp. T82-1]ODS50542.1 MAG: hypothetical protein A8274_503 [Halanaerobium sp. 4-GBenrich]OEG62820.1 MAG: hypothetical protein BHK79_06100 [Halanaerobium sp. MDAL1]PUU89037.1 MAG: hypothetical protein CI948_2098 [Halanaerobium sp.]PTX16455.1 hypothetical protein C7953_1174 [Halanaerobium congolense]